MSASLVGSEMCIRDSSSSAGSRPPRGEPCPRAGPERLYVVVRAPRGTSCLLYTSDAADDM
eukprot:5176471-Alexandrium_andersonii.AAC.1